MSQYRRRQPGSQLFRPWQVSPVDCLRWVRFQRTSYRTSGILLRIAQKLAYLYSWPEMFSDDDGLDDATRQLLMLFMGVMFGVKGATDVVAKVAAAVSVQVAKKLPQKALTKAWVYQITKKIATQYLGKTMNKKVFSSGVAKFVPIVGGVVSGGITFAAFRPMCARLRDHLSGLDLADPKLAGTQR